jgi:pilus assembly protein CpaF
MSARESSPLLLIERTVQELAAREQVDVDTPDGRRALRQLIDDTVASWGGGRSGLGDPDRVAERAYRNLAGYGPLESLLDDDDVWEIMINGPDGALH